MFKLDMPVDSRVVQAVERRRAAEAARHERIFSTRSRVIGVDTIVLEQQIAERRNREEVEKQQDLELDTLRVSIDHMVLEQVKEEEQRRRELAEELQQYRALCQRPEDSRDADINYKHQGAPSVYLPSEESLGPASMQVFQGEGIGEEEKKRFQMELNERTFRAQREERDRQEKEKKHKDMLRDMELMQRNLIDVQLDALEEECKRAARMALKSYNQAQVDERRERERQEKLRQEGEGMKEVWHMVTSDLLTESPEAAAREGERSAEAPRVLPDRWKGMSPKQLSAIYRQREEQRAEKENQWPVCAVGTGISLSLCSLLSAGTETAGEAKGASMGFTAAGGGERAGGGGEETEGDGEREETTAGQVQPAAGPGAADTPAVPQQADLHQPAHCPLLQPVQHKLTLEDSIPY
ncbi:RIB43A-like with coiled-coils protein 1 isoform X1 [Astyanax mexicanus]|uniref:RIB43A-like with coiled-coils protein 1 isoform X1 n=1 Tax=Astyanax mexicanus TaxID=7994 RepID=UPI0020CB2731|nr:RIB43A-like with coiled-coils protein 1 isoform X1 [Astyanax mexicanus]